VINCGGAVHVEGDGQLIDIDTLEIIDTPKGITVHGKSRVRARRVTHL
jgi:hypothetical protein